MVSYWSVEFLGNAINENALEVRDETDSDVLATQMTTMANTASQLVTTVQSLEADGVDLQTQLKDTAIPKHVKQLGDCARAVDDSSARPHVNSVAVSHLYSDVLGRLHELEQEVSEADGMDESTREYYFL